jgi:hypothetical protein
MSKKTKRIEKSEVKFTKFDILLALIRSLMFVFLLIPLLLTAGKLQPFLNFIVIGFFLAIFGKNRLILVAEAFLTLILASFIWPKIINPKFFDATALLPDPLLHGDVVVQSVFGDLMAYSFNLSIFQDKGPLKLFVLGVFFIPIGYLFRYLIGKLYSAIKQKLKAADRLNESTIFALILIAVLLVYDLAIPYVNIRETVAAKEQPYKYSVDYRIYKRTYELMRDYGIGYYLALNQAVNEDARNVGGSEGWLLLTPLWVRQPYLFYFWRFLGSIHPLLILVAAVMLLFFGLSLVIIGFESRFFKGASFLPLSLLYPFYYLSIGWIYLFAPELWASLFMLISMGLLLFGRRVAALIFAGFSMVSRIIFAGYHLVVGGYLTIRSFIEKRRRDLIRYPLITVFFLLFPAVNYYLVKTKYSFILRGSSLVKSEPTIGFLGISLKPSLAGFAKSLTWISNFLAYPYTLHLYYGTAVLIVGVLAFLGKIIIMREFQDEDIIGVVLAAYILLFVSSNHVCQYYNSIIFPQALFMISAFLAVVLSLIKRKAEG